MRRSQGKAQPTLPLTRPRLCMRQKVRRGPVVFSSPSGSGGNMSFDLRMAAGKPKEINSHSHQCTPLVFNLRMAPGGNMPLDFRMAAIGVGVH